MKYSYVKILAGVLLLLCLVPRYCKAEDYYVYTYTYDDAGNRISRTVQVYTKSASMGEIELDTLNMVAPEEMKQSKEFVVPFANGSFKLYPNPTTGIVNLESGMTEWQNKATNIFLYNMQGKVVKHFTFKDNACRIDLSAYANGEYIILLKHAADQLKFKVVKAE